MGDFTKKKGTNREVNICVATILIVVILFTIGYSAFSDNLSITGVVAMVKPDPKVRITSVIATSNGATVSATDYTYNTISSSVSMPNNSTVTYNVEVSNFGNEPMAIYSIDTSNLPSDLKILSITGYNVGDKICTNGDSNKCTLNAVKTFTIEIGYDNYTGNVVHQISLGFEFVRTYDITYSHITNNGYPAVAHEGKPFQVTFTGDVPVDVIVSPSHNYTYQNGVLSMPSVTSDITIDRYYSITYDARGGANPQDQPDKYLAATTVNILNPSKNGDTFIGWYTNNQFTGNVITSTSGLSGDLTLYAKWQSDSGYIVGQKVLINLESKNTSSSWKTNTNGYDATSGQYKLTDNTYLGSSSGTWTKENLEWYIWKYEEGTKLVLISVSPTSNNLILNYAKSYNNSLFFMNDISSQIYGCNIDGISARSINMVDILEKVFEYKQSVTYENENISLVDNDGKALTSIITENGTVMEKIIKALFNSSYGTVFSGASVQKYMPQTIYDLMGLTGNNPAVNFSGNNNIRNFETNIISAPVTTGTHSTGNFKPISWSYSITSFANVIDSVSLSMLQSNNTYWIASRDYQSESNSNKSSFDYNVKQWNNNQIVPATIYKSNVTSGQTALSGAIRPMIEVDLTKVKISADGTITALS